MARINIEDEWFSDLRRFKLASLIRQAGETEIQAGRKVDGLMLSVWFFAFQFYKKGELIPEHAWETVDHREEIISSGLAEKREDGIYVRGSSRHFEWYKKKTKILRERAQKGGLARIAGAKRGKNGQLEPAVNQLTTSLTSPSSSSSSSYKYNNSSNSLSQSHLDELELIYNKYPRKEGKSPGMRFLHKKLNPEEIPELSLAVDNYCRKTDGKDKEYIMHWKTFVRSWRDHLDNDTAPILRI